LAKQQTAGLMPAVFLMPARLVITDILSTLAATPPIQQVVDHIDGVDQGQVDGFRHHIREEAG
jgi:hypothetical protein